MIVDALISINEEELPYLMLADGNKRGDKLGQTPLDLAIEAVDLENKILKNEPINTKIVESLLKLIVYHKSAAREYNKHIDQHLIVLIRMNINLKDLF